MTKAISFFLIIGLLFFGSSCTFKFPNLNTGGWGITCPDPPPPTPQVTTGIVSDISAVSANVSVIVAGAQSFDTRGICWIAQSPGVDTVPFYGNGTSVSDTIFGNGSFDIQIPIGALVPNQKYAVRAFSKTTCATTYGKVVTFTTLPKSIPVLSTTAVTDITTSSATGSGNVTSDGAGRVTTRGVCWSTNPGPTVDDHVMADTDLAVLQSKGLGIFTIALTDLTAGTRYYVRAYAINEVGISYGDEVSFDTP